MFLYQVSRPGTYGNDEYDSFVCAAGSDDEARTTHPTTDRSSIPIYVWVKDRDGWFYHGEKELYPATSGHGWPVRPDATKVECLGVAGEGVKPGVILASFNAD